MDNSNEIKKCSRCRVKRIEETGLELNKYSTCLKCRNKRKIVKKTASTINIEQELKENYNNKANIFFKFMDFLEALKTNKFKNLKNLKFIEINSSLPKFSINEINSQIDENDFYLQMSKKLIKIYIDPISILTGYKFVIRDYHKGGLKIKKISILFICSQDRTKQRKSRSKLKRNVVNKLKIYECFSKINFYYDLVSGKVVIDYSHNSHNACDSHKNQSDEIIYSPESNLQTIAVAAVDKFNSIGNIDDRLIA